MRIEKLERKNEHKRVKKDGDQMNLYISLLASNFRSVLKILSAHEGRKYNILCTALFQGIDLRLIL